LEDNRAMIEHHARCYVGLEFGKKQLAEYFLSVSLDTHILEYTDFGINEARTLSTRAYTNPLVEPFQTFVVVAENFTHEAQNALLKLLEEPPQRSRFCLVVPKRGQLLLTLQSRLFIVEEDWNAENQESGDFFNNFRAASYGERLALVATLVKEKNFTTIQELVDAAEVEVHCSGDRSLLQNILFVREHLGVRGSSAKMLLESLALALPQK